MKILTENIKLDAHMKDTLGVEIESVFDYTKLNQFNRGEAVGIYLHKLCYHTMDLVGLLLYYKHPVTLKYEGKQYKLYSKEDWYQTFQDPKDQIKTKTVRHPILQEYTDKQREQRTLYKEFKENRYRLYELKKYPEVTNEDRAKLLEQYALLYQMDVDYTDELSQTRAYYQIKFYIENDIQPDTDSLKKNIESFGNETYLEDMINKHQETLDIDYI